MTTRTAEKMAIAASSTTPYVAKPMAVVDEPVRSIRKRAREGRTAEQDRADAKLADKRMRSETPVPYRRARG